MIVLSLALPADAVLYRVSPPGSEPAGSDSDFPDIQSAVDASVDGDIIELAAGIFFGPGNVDIDLQGKAIAIRSIDANPNSSVIDCQGSPGSPHRAFLAVSGEGPATVLEGITILGGHMAGSWPEHAGAAILCRNASSPSIVNCFFRDNHAGSGGAISCDGLSSPRILYCRFENNDAVYYGGAIYCHDRSSPTLRGCYFLGNAAGYYGGGLRTVFSSPLILDCTFVDNEAGEGGGGLAFSGSSAPELLQCTIVGNVTGGNSGGIYSYYSEPLIRKTLIAFNSGSAVDVYGDQLPMLEQCDIFGNLGGDWIDAIAPQLGTYGNFSEDPLFCDEHDRDSFTVASNSPCAPDCNSCEDQIGAWPVGCLNFSAQETSWSELKAMGWSP